MVFSATDPKYQTYKKTKLLWQLKAYENESIPLDEKALIVVEELLDLIGLIGF